MSPIESSTALTVLLVLSITLGSSPARSDPAPSISDARQAFEAARAMAPGSDSKAAWRRAAAMYRQVLEAAPGADTAPEAAMNAAYAYRHINDIGAALDTYEIFVREGTRVLPTLASDPRRHTELAKYLADASQNLASAYVLNFDYAKAATNYDVVAASAAAGEGSRRDAAENALRIWSALGETGKAEAARAALFKVSLTPAQKADADALLAGFAYRRWDSKAPDEGANRDARRAAMSTMGRWLTAYKGEPSAQAHAVRIAHDLAELRRAGHEARADDACKDATRAFDRMRAADEHRALGSAEADLAAECAYGLLDREIGADFDRVMASHYKGTIPEVKKAYWADLERAKSYARRLEEIIAKFASTTWTIAAKARQGAVYDACWSALYFVRPPVLRLEERRDPGCDLIDDCDYRERPYDKYRTIRAEWLDQAARPMVLGYGQAVALQWSRRIHVAAADAALRRLAFFTDMFGDPQIRAYTADLGISRGDKPFAYSDGLFFRERPGMTLSRPADPLPAPAPAAP